MSRFSNDIDLDEVAPVKKWPPGAGILFAVIVSAILWVGIIKLGAAALHEIFG